MAQQIIGKEDHCALSNTNITSSESKTSRGKFELIPNVKSIGHTETTIMSE